MAAAAGSGVAGAEDGKGKEKKKNEMDAKTFDFLSKIRRACKKKAAAFRAEGEDGAYVEIGAYQRMYFRKDGGTELIGDMQRTIRDIYLPDHMRGRGFLSALVFILATRGAVDGKALEAVQIESVMNPRLRKSLESNTMGGLNIKWHDQTYHPQGQPKTVVYNPSFVWFC